MSGTISPPPSKRRKLSGSEAITPYTDDLTVYSWNVNGIQPILQRPITAFFRSQQLEKPHDGNLKASLRDFLRRHNWPSLLFLQEVKISPDDTSSIRSLEKAVRADPRNSTGEPDYVAHLCLPSDKHNARGFGRRVYGVCSIIRTDFAEKYVARVRPVEWDTEGRYLVTETRAVDGKPKLALFNVYMVNGTDNAYRNPLTGEMAGTRHDRKLQAHKLLAAECRDLQVEGFGIVIAGDINIARTALDGFPHLRTFPRQHCINRADFEARFLSRPSASVSDLDSTPTAEANAEPAPDEKSEDAALGMIDTFRHLHLDKKGYTYYPRGKAFGESCDRVDMVIVSDSLEHYIAEAGMHETLGDRGPSDHVPLYARLAFKKASRKPTEIEQA